MAYDPYSTSQYDYYQDPYQAGGYDYEGYEDPYPPSPPPTPDKNWVDPVQVNRQYVRKIQKNCILKGFEGLKEDGLYLFEVVVGSISLKKSILENSESEDKKDKQFMTFFKFLDMSFVEVNEAQTVPVKRLSGEYKPSSVLANRKSLTNLFQSIYSTTGYDFLSLEAEDEPGRGEDEERSENQSKEATSVSSNTGNPNEKIDADNEEFVTIEMMMGKSVLVPMPGLSMIQKLQQYPLVLKVTQCDVTEEGAEIEGEILATSFIRIPKTFHKAVLTSCKPKTRLPLVVVTTDKHQLVDPWGSEVGNAELTLVLTCFGKGAVNCVTEFENSLNFDHTFLLRHLKAKHVVADHSHGPEVDPRLAKEIIKLGLFFPSKKTSSEILQHCLSTNLVPTDLEDVKRAQNRRDCGWFHMVKKACPSSSHSFDIEMYVKDMEMEKAALWLKHKKICRDLKTKEPELRKSLEERFRELQIQLPGGAGGEAPSPLDEPSNRSMNEQSYKTVNSNRSGSGSSRTANL